MASAIAVARGEADVAFVGGRDMPDGTLTRLTFPGRSPILGSPETTPLGTSERLTPGRMGDTLFVGNDIVDLGHRKCPGKSRDLRFLNRIFHSSEASRILSDEDPDRSLWLHWAAKEAAFKVLSKILEATPVFSHAQFIVRVERDPGARSGGFPIWGTVDWSDVSLPFRAAVNATRVHALSWSGQDPNRDAPEIEIATGEAFVGSGDILGTGAAPFEFMVKERFSERERLSIHSPGSAYGRLLARTAIADSLDVEEKRLEIVCGDRPSGRTPPRVLLDGKPAGVDVSLSHHGDQVAWAHTMEKRGGVES